MSETALDSFHNLNYQSLPAHIGIIMDGNGRWAKARGYQRSKGHKEGLTVAKAIVKRISELHIPYVTLFTFSTENWKRTTDEVGFLMNLLKIHLKAELSFYAENNLRVKCIGNRSQLPVDVVKEINLVEQTTKDNTNTTVTLAINYGGKDEIIRAIHKIDKNNITNISEKNFGDLFDFPDLPEIDLLIRTGNEKRISNFLLWHVAYSELYFSECLWPDWTEKHLDKALIDYQQRYRRYGGIK